SDDVARLRDTGVVSQARHAIGRPDAGSEWLGPSLLRPRGVVARKRAPHRRPIVAVHAARAAIVARSDGDDALVARIPVVVDALVPVARGEEDDAAPAAAAVVHQDRKSTRLNS